MIDVDTAPPLSTPAALAAGIVDAWGAWLLRGRRQPTPHASVWASAWRPCERRMYYEVTCPDQQAPFDGATLARFRRGDDRERDLLADLARIGRDAVPAFDVIGQQERFALRDRRGRDAIAGKVDARIRFDDARYSAPLEVKAWAPSIVDRLSTFADVFENPWTRSGGYQLLSYLFGANEPYGFLLLDRSGLPLVLPVELDAHLDRLEDFLSRAERVLDHTAAGTVPDFIDDATECKRCPFYGGTCNPPLSAAGVQVFADPSLEADLERWHQLRDAGKEWAALDADLKRRLRGVDAGVCGHFAITGTWGRSSRLELPDVVRKQFTITEPRGRFSLVIERL